MPMNELIIRILCDTSPADLVDGAYLFCQTRDNQLSVIRQGADLIDTGRIRRILILNAPAQSGYPGYEAAHAALVEAGVDPGDIIGVPFEAGMMLNTLTESRALTRFARETGIDSLYVISAPFHQTRAFMTAVTATIEIFHELRLHSVPGNALPWLEEVAHSQGTTRGIRKDLIAGEFERIAKYQRKGDLADTSAVLDYLDRRDD